MSTAMMNVDSEKLERVMDAFRRWGYLQANLDPLGHFAPLPHPELDSPGDAADAARRIYSGSIGVEFMHIPDLSAGSGSRSEWRPSSRSRSTGVAILDQLVRADVFEQTIHSRYIGTKRYSLEGNTALDSAAGRNPELGVGKRRRAGGAGHEPSRTTERHH